MDLILKIKARLLINNPRVLNDMEYNLYLTDYILDTFFSGDIEGAKVKLNRELFGIMKEKVNIDKNRLTK